MLGLMTTKQTTHPAREIKVGASASPRKADGYLITASGLAAMRDRVAQLRLAKDREIGGRLHEARAFGDPSVNDEYMAIREDEGVLDSRIYALERLISRARVIDSAPSRKNAAAIGSVVQIEDLKSRRVEHLRITVGLDSGGAGTVSAASPVGRALVGQQVGAKVEIPLPDGRTRALEIRAITTGPQSSSQA
jgi:transcription elongation GreA/GreB family factor